MIMKAFRIFMVHLREGMKALYRNMGLAFTSIITMNITLFVVALAVTLSINVYNATNEVRKDLSLTVFLKLEVDTSRAKELVEDFKEYNNVATVELSNKENERLLMIGSYPEMDELLSYFEGENNIFYNVLHIRTTDVDLIDDVVEEIREHPEVEEVSYSKGLIDSLISVLKVIEYTGYAIVVALLVVTLVVVSNTIKITIFSRKRNIEIMRLVGAKKGYIVAPHIVEGIIIGVFGSVAPIILMRVLYIEFYTQTGGSLPISPFITFVEPALFINHLSLALLGVGVVVSVLGSRRSVRKYLRRK